MSIIALETQNLQDQLLTILKSSKENKITDENVKIRPYVFDTIQLIEKNQKLHLSDQETLNKIRQICSENTKNLNIAMGNHKYKKRQDKTLKNETILANIHARIVHDVEICIMELNIESNNQPEKEEVEEEDYYVEINPNPCIIHHY